MTKRLTKGRRRMERRTTTTKGIEVRGFYGFGVRRLRMKGPSLSIYSLAPWPSTLKKL
jgi:hypothetical protein